MPQNKLMMDDEKLARSRRSCPVWLQLKLHICKIFRVDSKWETTVHSLTNLMGRCTIQTLFKLYHAQYSYWKTSILNSHIGYYNCPCLKNHGSYILGRNCMGQVPAFSRPFFLCHAEYFKPLSFDHFTYFYLIVAALHK